MDVTLTPETQSRLHQLAAQTGRAPGELVEEIIEAHLDEFAAVQHLLDGRYDDLQTGRVTPIDGEEAFVRLERKSVQRRSGS